MEKRLSYTELGQGPAVILLHGFPLAGSIWKAQQEHLSTKYRVILPDLPGHGATAPVPGISIAQMADLVFDLMDHLQIHKAAVAGHSMGGYVALAMVKQAPERIAGLGLVATQAGADSPEAREGRFALAEKVGREGQDVVANAMPPKLFATDDPSNPAQQATASLIRQTPREGIQAALHAMAGREDLQPLLPTISAPTLVLAGKEDRLIPVQRSEGMAAQIPNAVLVRLPGAGHMPMLERPEEVSAALEGWLGLVY